MECDKCIECHCASVGKTHIICNVDQKYISDIVVCPIDRLAAYEKAEEQGVLVRLPCKVGDTVYRIIRHRVDVSGYRMEWEWETAVEAVPFRIGMVDAIGKSVFLTREEAEAALSKEELHGLQ